MPETNYSGTTPTPRVKPVTNSLPRVKPTPTQNDNVTDRKIKNLSYPQAGLGETGLKSYIIFEVVKEKTLNPTTFIRKALEQVVDYYNEITGRTSDEAMELGVSSANALTDGASNAVGVVNTAIDEEGGIIDGGARLLSDAVDYFQGKRPGIEEHQTDFLTDGDDLSYQEPETYQGSIKLYMPQFVFNDGVSYDNAELGVLGAAAVSGSTGKMGDMFDTGISLAKSSVADIMRGGENSGAAASLALQRLKSVPVLGELFVKNISAVQSATRVKSSPNVRVLYNSTNLRTFSFSFNLIASSSSEAKEIEEIVKTFREELYPEAMVMKLGSVNTEVGLMFPNRFKLTLMYGDNPVFHKIKPCYLTSMSTTYNKSQSGMHYDGKPFEVDITLNFSESLALNRRDIEDGY
jgi:hypothetical protein